MLENTFYKTTLFFLFGQLLLSLPPSFPLLCSPQQWFHYPLPELQIKEPSPLISQIMIQPEVYADTIFLLRHNQLLTLACALCHATRPQWSHDLCGFLISNNNRTPSSHDKQCRIYYIFKKCIL